MKAAVCPIWLVMLQIVSAWAPCPAAAAQQTSMVCSRTWESSDLQALAFAPDGTIFTANFSTGYVGHYAAGGAELSSWSLPRGPQGSLFWPIGIGLDAQGDVYVSDHGNRCVYKCSASGMVLDTLGWGTLIAPRGVACDRQNGHVYVCDGQGYAIREFDETGELLRSVPADWYVSDVALGDNGELYASAYNGRVYRFAADGSLLITWQPADAAPNTSFPSLARGSDGRVHVVDRAATRVRVLTGDLQEIGAWSLDCADLNLGCLLNGHSYSSETLTGISIGDEGQAVLGTDCLPNQVAVFASVPVPVHSTTWGRVKTLYR